MAAIIKPSIVILFVLFACGERINSTLPVAPANVDLTNAFYYTINLNDRTDLTFKVRMFVDRLTQTNEIFQFAATAPGTYSILDFGRFVRKFKAFDKSYNELSVTHPTTNQWKLSDPERTRVIEFEIAETFHHPVPTHRVAYSSIAYDNVIINPFAVLGYPTGLKERGFYLKIDLPPDWTTGTSLAKTDDGYYYASDYGRLADFPLLMGSLTTASTSVGNTEFNVFTYSKTNKISAAQIVDAVGQVWQDASKFLKGLPVKRYNYLYHFDDSFSGNPLEHSSSSMFPLTEFYFAQDLGRLKTTSAHEFFHVMTPLTIHSEIIEDFNFAYPTASEHLWWYEGVTVWASIMMQYRNGSINLKDLPGQFASHGPIQPQVSLSNIGLNCYVDGTQWGNAYTKGALAAALLDIRLLELSKGTKGLRELILELFEKYHDQPFPENSFNDILTDMTYPEIGEFLKQYVKGTEELPIVEYFNKLGINYDNRWSLIENSTAEQQTLFNRWSVNF